MEKERKQTDIVSELRKLEQKEEGLRSTLRKTGQLEEESQRQTKRAQKTQGKLEEYYRTKDGSLYELLLEKGAALQKKENQEAETFYTVRKTLKKSMEEGEKQRKQLAD